MRGWYKGGEVGFDPGAALFRLDPHTGYGLFSVRERLEHLGGRFEIQSRRGRGTEVILVASVLGTADGGPGFGP